MIKTVPLLTVCLGTFLTARAQQDLAGFRTSNYSGVNAVFSNPASIADSRYRWDVNVFGINANVSNNQAQFKLKDLGKTFDEDKITDQLFGKEAGTTSGLAAIALHLPSFMVSVGPKMAFAVTTRARVLANINEMDGKLVNQVRDVTENTNLPYTISSNSNMGINVSGWTEIGASFAREAYVTGAHYFKAGATLKYLSGIGNVNVHLSDFKGTINADILAEDAYLSNATAKVGVASSGVNIADFEVDQLTKISGRGMGADLGVVYEWRPESDVVRNASGGYERAANQYKLRVGISVLDIGRIKFDRDLERSAAYNMSVTGSERFYLSELEGVSLNDYTSAFNEHPEYFAPDESANTTKYKVSLPTTLQINADYHIHQHFYVNANGQIAMTKGTKKPYNGQYYSGVSVTPRYEGRKFGFSLPLNYNGLTKFNAGASFSAGPLYVGSGSVLTALFGNSKQADVFIGFRFGQLYKVKKNHTPSAENAPS
jgi:hypothetical protein